MNEVIDYVERFIRTNNPNTQISQLHWSFSFKVDFLIGYLFTLILRQRLVFISPPPSTGIST